MPPVDINIEAALLSLKRIKLDASGYQVNSLSVVKAPAAYVSDPKGGAVIDTEGREIFKAFRDLLVYHGLMMEESADEDSEDPPA